MEILCTKKANVPIPPGVTAVNFGSEHPIVKNLDYGLFALGLEYYNRKFDFEYNYVYRLQHNQPIPGSDLIQDISIVLKMPRKVDWEHEKQPKRMKNSELGIYNKSDAGIIEVDLNSLNGKFWSNGLWRARRTPKLNVKLAEFPITFDGPYEDRMSITSAGFLKRNVGLGEIDAFLDLIENLPVLELAYR